MPIGKLPIRAHTATRFEIEGRERVMFAGCDYLGLSHHPALIEALVRGAREHGISSSGSRTTSGNRLVYDQLEARLARFLGTEDAVIASDGYIANLLAAQALQQRCGSALVDADAHVSLADAIRATRIRPITFVSGAELREAAASRRDEPLLIASDGLYPAACKIADLPLFLSQLGSEGSAVLIDDCHAIGVLGASGKGSLEFHQMHDPRIMVSGTFSKALGCHGGFVAGSRENIEAVCTQAHAYVGSTAFPAALGEAVLAALELVDSTASPLPALRANLQRVRRDLLELGVPAHSLPIPVFALKLGSKQRMRALHEHLYAQDLFVPLVEYPDGRGAYLRIAMCAAHTVEDLDRLRSGLADALQSCP
jgi:7-keto-8-aminopelargonate synthetase-like enzyme